jgi:hypothetical protein
MSVPLCVHIKEDGISCHSPALTGERHCHFHLRYKGYRLRTWRARRPVHIQLPVLDSLVAVRFGMKQVREAMLGNKLDHKQAGLALYAMQILASTMEPGPANQRLQPPAGEERLRRALEHFI